MIAQYRLWRCVPLETTASESSFILIYNYFSGSSRLVACEERCISPASCQLPETDEEASGLSQIDARAGERFLALMLAFDFALNCWSLKAQTLSLICDADIKLSYPDVHRYCSFQILHRPLLSPVGFQQTDVVRMDFEKNRPRFAAIVKNSSPLR